MQNRTQPSASASHQAATKIGAAWLGHLARRTCLLHRLAARVEHHYLASPRMGDVVGAPSSSEGVARRLEGKLFKLSGLVTTQRSVHVSNLLFRVRAAAIVTSCAPAHVSLSCAHVPSFCVRSVKAVLLTTLRDVQVDRPGRPLRADHSIFRSLRVRSEHTIWCEGGQIQGLIARVL